VSERIARQPVGALLRQWRERRRLSQLNLALQAGVSARHVSFIETGRAQPSREMLLHLAHELNVPLRERNPMLLAAGYAPAYSSRNLADDEMAPIRDALDLILTGYQPYPALAVDQNWNLVAANSSVSMLISGATVELLQPPVNVLRLSLHPDGLASQILNLAQWRGHVLDRLAREVAATGNRDLALLHQELLTYPGGIQHGPGTELAVPLRIRLADQELAFLSTVTTFGTAVDITLAELSIEAFLPADSSTVAALHNLTSVAT
jgi:transcriptional regulator with XRE-family HTH domain